MGVKLELLSKNLVLIIDKLIKDEKVSKLIYYNTNDIFSRPDISPSIIAPLGETERVLPYPFDTSFTNDERTQIHVYFPDLDFVNAENAESTVVFFDIVTHRNLWLFSEFGEKLIRPYEIASSISRLFDGSLPNTKSTVGKLNFLSLKQVHVNEEFSCVRLVATMTTY